MKDTLKDSENDGDDRLYEAIAFGCLWGSVIITSFVLAGLLMIFVHDINEFVRRAIVLFSCFSLLTIFALTRGFKGIRILCTYLLSTALACSVWIAINALGSAKPVNYVFYVLLCVFDFLLVLVMLGFRQRREISDRLWGVKRRKKREIFGIFAVLVLAIPGLPGLIDFIPGSIELIVDTVVDAKRGNYFKMAISFILLCLPLIGILLFAFGPKIIKKRHEEDREEIEREIDARRKESIQTWDPQQSREDKLAIAERVLTGWDKDEQKRLKDSYSEYRAGWNDSSTKACEERKEMMESIEKEFERRAGNGQ